jgi:predicted ribosomally synthesized peptide with nif11-like leader
VPIQEALAFIGQARRDEALGRDIDARDEDDSLEALVGVAERAGFHFTVEELQRAHALDWDMRRARYAPRD